VFDPRIIHASRKLHALLSQPFRGAKIIDVQAGKGHIASAYKAADELSDALGEERAPRVTGLRRVA
jgi:hypothetical protein